MNLCYYVIQNAYVSKKEEELMMKHNIGYLPNMGKARETIKKCLEFYSEEQDNRKSRHFFESTFGTINDNTLRLVQNTLKNYELIMESDDYVYKTTKLGKDWLKFPQYEALIRILDEHVEFIGDLLVELRKNDYTSKELMEVAKCNYGIILHESDMVRRLQILRDAEIVKMNRHKKYSLTESGKKFLGNSKPFEVVERKEDVKFVDNNIRKQNQKNSFINNRHNDNQSKFLYHYCTVQELLEIMNEKKFCFWDLYTSNRNVTLETVIERIKERALEKKELAEYESDNNLWNRKKLEEPFEDFLDRIYMKMRSRLKPFIFSMDFSDTLDFLCENYVDDGKGAVIGISLENIEKLNKDIFELKKIRRWEDMQDIISDSAQYLLMVYKDNFTGDNSRKEDLVVESLLKKIYDIYEPLGIGRYTERKWRLIYKDNIQGKDLQKINFTENENKIVPYCSIRENMEVLPIKKIVPGPNCRMTSEEIYKWMSLKNIY